MKVSVAPEIASAFKTACITSNVSMTGKLSEFMSDYSEKVTKIKALPEYTTRRQRKKAIKDIIEQLKQIRASEERCRDNLPENLQGSATFDNAEQSASVLDEVIELMDSIY